MFADLLPGMIPARELAQFVLMYAGSELDGDLQITLAAADVPELHLDGNAATGCLPLLGLNTWLGGVSGRDSVDEAVFPLRKLAEKRDFRERWSCRPP